MGSSFRYLNLPILALALLLSSNAAQSAPKSAAEWVPTTPWNVEYADDQCLASRSYQAANSEILVAFRPRPTDDFVQIIVLAPGKLDDIQIAKATVHIGGEIIDRRSLTITPAAKTGHLLYKFNLEPEDFAKLKRSPRLAVKSAGLEFQVPLSRLADVHSVLADCIADLLTTWGVSREIQASVASFPHPKMPLASYVGDGDYPNSALGAGNVGAVEARLTVGKDGKPRDCKITQSSGHKDLDDRTCKVVTSRARFVPGQLKDGRSIELPFIFVLRWAMGAG